MSKLISIKDLKTLFRAPRVDYDFLMAILANANDNQKRDFLAIVSARNNPTVHSAKSQQSLEEIQAEIAKVKASIVELEDEFPDLEAQAKELVEIKLKIQMRLHGMDERTVRVSLQRVKIPLPVIKVEVEDLEESAEILEKSVEKNEQYLQNLVLFEAIIRDPESTNAFKKLRTRRMSLFQEIDIKKKVATGKVMKRRKSVSNRMSVPEKLPCCYCGKMLVPSYVLTHERSKTACK